MYFPLRSCCINYFPSTQPFVVPTMTNTIFVLVLVLLFAHQSVASSNCAPNQTKLSSYLLSHRPYILDLMCRGFPNHLSIPLYNHTLSNLLFRFVSTTPDVPLRSICIPTPPLEPKSLINIPTLNKTLTDLLSRHPSLSYLPRSHFPRLPNLPPSLLAPLNHLNDATETELNSATPASLSPTPLLHFPPPLPYLYDPLHSDVCHHYHYFTPPNSTTIPAPDFLHQVVALVLQLHFLSIPKSSSLVLLYHNLAFTFIAIRCTKTEAHKLYLPAVFMPWYQQAFDSLISHFSQPAIPPITSTLVRKILGQELHVFATHAAWGHPNLLIVKDGVVQTKTVSEIIFDANTLASIRTYLKRTSSSEMSLSSRLSLSSLALRLSCQQGLYSYSSPPRIPRPICCPSLCRQLHLLAKVRWNTETCCFEYMRNPRSLLTGPLRDVATVYLKPYPPGSSVTIKVKI